MINKAYLKGLGYGLTSGVITTLGLMVGLNAGTGSKIAVIGGILVIAVGDSMSDALGMHVSEESVGDAKNKDTTADIWRATFSTFIFKFLVALLFLIPVFLLPLNYAVWASVIFGLAIIGVFSYIFAKQQGVKPSHVVLEHLGIAALVVFLTKLVGDGVAYFFNTSM